MVVTLPVHPKLEVAWSFESRLLLESYADGDAYVLKDGLGEGFYCWGCEAGI